MAVRPRLTGSNGGGPGARDAEITKAARPGSQPMNSTLTDARFGPTTDGRLFGRNGVRNEILGKTRRNAIGSRNCFSAFDGGWCFHTHRLDTERAAE